ncbi:MAG: hypothetical protein GY805_35605, partial [Chloroflexi bacterium]|nr:hypothetical protein [Chloroflexota bacterium]
MPKSTQIIKWRTRRQRQRQRGGLHMARWVSVLILGLTTAVFTFILLGVLGITAVFTSFNRDLPSFTELENLGQDNTVPFETSKIYAWGNPNANGQRDPILIYEIIDPLDGEHQWLPLDQIPQQFIDATIASEDPTFWSSQNIDLIDIGRTFNQYMLQGGNIQGRSSIIQQVVKNNLIEIETLDGGAENGLNDYQRLLQEMLLARQVSQSYSKEQILEWHLNTNFYGNLAYGIESAARIYFDKPAAELSLAEVAMLAAISQSPNWNPINNPEAAKVQQELVLDGMVREGMIRAETAVSTKQLPVPIINPIADRYEIIAPHFALFVQAQLEEMFDPEQLLGGGLRVYTSLDLSYQQQAECVTRAHVNRLSGIIGSGLPADEQSSCAALDFLPSFDQADAGIDHEVSNAAVLMLDSETAEIKAMVGSLNYWNPAIDGSFNMAVDGLRQPGSAFIPFIYLTALSQGYSAASMVLDVETDFSNANSGIPYVPQNDDRQFHGPMRLRQALGNSYNIPAVQVMSWVGINKVLRTAHNLGINSLDQGNSSYGLDLTLNGGEVSLLDMTYAFSVMDNMGVMIGQPRPTDQTQPGYRTLDPVAILRVEDRNGNVLYEYDQPQQREILTPQLAYIMNDMLSDRST